MPALLLGALTACQDEPVPESSFRFEHTAMESAVLATWDEADGLLRWQDEQGWHTANPRPQSDGTTQAWVVAAPDSHVLFEFTTNGVVETFETWTDSSEFPADIESIDGDFGTSTITTLYTEESWMPTVLGPDGTPRWWLDDIERELTTMRVRPTVRGVWMNVFTTRHDAPNPPELRLYGWDGTLLETIDAPDNHHDFWVHDDGTVVWIARFDMGNDYWGDELRMRDPETGAISTLFSTDQIGEVAQKLEAKGSNEAWSNHLSFDGERYWLSIRALDLMAVIDTDGNLVETIGDGGDIEPDVRFEGQHGGEPTDQGFLLHDNTGDNGIVRVSEYRVDEDSGTATLIWSRQPQASWSSLALGDAIRCDYNRTRISWGVFSTLEQLDHHGDVIATMEFEPTVLVSYLEEATIID